AQVLQDGRWQRVAAPHATFAECRYRVSGLRHDLVLRTYWPTGVAVVPTILARIGWATKPESNHRPSCVPSDAPHAGAGVSSYPVSGLQQNDHAPLLPSNLS